MSGTIIEEYTLTNADGLAASILSYGGILASLRVPDREGALGDVTLGFDSPDAYRQTHPYFGALVGRYANRVSNGRFELRGRSYTLARNDGPNQLHGGDVGFDKAYWNVAEHSSSRLSLTHRSPDGDEGYPGTLDVEVVYSLTGDNELRIDYTATTDQLTVLNLSNHTYFNLGTADTILDHELQLNAGAFLPVDATMIPTGELRPVAGTAFDFRTPVAIGARLDRPDEQLRLAGDGYDQCWVLDRGGPGLAHAAQVYEPLSGRVMDVFTTQPAVQFYTGNQLDGSISGKNGRVYGKYAGLCLETQHYPDSPNRPEFPSTELAPGQTYRHTTIYRFGVR